MKAIPYYHDQPGSWARMVGNEAHLSLEGYMQQYVDGLHIIMANHFGTNAQPLDGVDEFELHLPRALAQLDQMAIDYPKQIPGAVPAGKTAQGLARFYKTKATELFKAYGRS